MTTQLREYRVEPDAWELFLAPDPRQFLIGAEHHFVEELSPPR